MNRNKKRYGLYWALFAFIVVLAAVKFIFPHLYSSLFATVAKPFWRTEFSLVSGSLRSAQSLLLENESLKQKLVDADIRLQATKSVENENRELKALYGREISLENEIFSTSTLGSSIAKNSLTPSPFLLAAVLIRPPLTAYDTLVIDIGKNFGLADGDLVYASPNILLGEIAETQSETSKVLLYSSPGQSRQVLIGDRHIAATVLGHGGGQYSAQLPRSDSVNIGDSVISSAINELPIGYVKAVLADPSQPFETVLVDSSVNLFEMRWVLVKKNNKTE